MSEISVSILSVNKENAVSIFYNLETAKINYFHIDVMDGKFVENNNLELMKDYALTISHISNIGLDVHLMVENVEQVMDDYIPLEPRIITFHYEAIQDKSRIMNIIEDIKQNGIKVGIAISPETSVDNIKEFLPYVHQVLVMTVVPGKGGQKLIPATLEKITDLKQYINDNDLDIDIEADGGINDETAQNVRKAGCDILVSGNYIIASENYNEAVKKLKEE
jgi:ribulose-phosphate 3-epimerase